MVRSYAMALITDTCPAAKKNSDGYEPDTEQDMENEEGDKDEKTPMKKKKGDKPKVPDLIKAQHDDLAIIATQEDMEVRVISL